MKRRICTFLLALLTGLSLTAQAVPAESNPFASLGELVGAGVATFIVILAICLLIPIIFYLISLQKAMNSISLEKKPFAGGLVWLTFIPVLGVIWLLVFIIITSISLKRQLKNKDLSGDGGFGVGIAFVACTIGSIIFISSKQYAVISIIGLASFILWIIHWVKITKARNALIGLLHQATTGITANNTKGIDEVFCRSCGAIIKKEAEICVKCGVRQISN